MIKGRLQGKLQTAIAGTDHTVTTNDITHPKLMSKPGTLHRSPRTKNKLSSPNKHNARGLNEKYRSLKSGKPKPKGMKSKYSDEEIDFEVYDQTNRESVKKIRQGGRDTT